MVVNYRIIKIIHHYGNHFKKASIVFSPLNWRDLSETSVPAISAPVSQAPDFEGANYL